MKSVSTLMVKYSLGKVNQGLFGSSILRLVEVYVTRMACTVDDIDFESNLCHILVNSDIRVMNDVKRDIK